MLRLKTIEHGTNPSDIFRLSIRHQKRDLIMMLLSRRGHNRQLFAFR